MCSLSKREFLFDLSRDKINKEDSILHHQYKIEHPKMETEKRQKKRIVTRGL